MSGLVVSTRTIPDVDVIINPVLNLPIYDKIDVMVLFFTVYYLISRVE